MTFEAAFPEVGLLKIRAPPSVSCRESTWPLIIPLPASNVSGH
jgi:hypothetical protein